MWKAPALDAVKEQWAQLTPRDVGRLLSMLPIRWWIAGGWALDVDGREAHKDVDVAVLRPDHEVLRDYLAGWDLRIAYGGVLKPWIGGPVGPPENAVWARPTPNDLWHIDFKIEAVERGEWVYRRDPAVRRPVADIGVVVDGIPYLAPDLARLYARRAGNADALNRVRRLGSGFRLQNHRFARRVGEDPGEIFRGEPGPCTGGNHDPVKPLDLPQPLERVRRRAPSSGG